MSNNLLLNKKIEGLAISNLIEELEDESIMPLLIEKRYRSEKMNEDPFKYFSDIDMVYYYIHNKKNIDDKKNRSENTKREYLRDILQFSTNLVEYADNIGIDIDKIIDSSLFKSLKPRHIEMYQNWLQKNAAYIIGRNSNFSPSTISRKTTVLRGFLTFLENNGYVKYPLASRLKSATVSKDDRPNRDLSPYEVIQLLDYFYKMEKHPIIFALIHFLVTTGIRNQELCVAKVKDLTYDSERSELYLFVNGKGNKKRYVPVKPKVIDSLNEFRRLRGLESIEESPPNSPLFTTSTGASYSNSYLSQYLKKAVRRVELPFVSKRENPITPHTFRHAFAIISYHQKVDPYTIMRSLGHENIETTMIYLQKEFEKDKHATHSWNDGFIKEYV